VAESMLADYARNLDQISETEDGISMDDLDEQGVSEGSDEEDVVAAARAARAKLEKPAVFRKHERFLPSKDKDWMVTPDELTAAGELPSREFALRKKEQGLEEEIVDIKRLAGLK
jgi:hypothetical protein